MKQVVIGGTIRAARYAFMHDLELAHLRLAPPHMFTDQSAEFNHLYFCLSLAGKVKYGGAITQIRITDEGIRVTAGRTVEVVGADEYLIYDDADLIGLPPKKNADALYEVLDWIDVRSGMKHGFNEIPITDSDFIKSIKFYPSERIDGNRNLKDACVVSHLSGSQLEEFEYSELVTRIKTEEMMASVGIKGAGNGVGRNYPIKLESSRREIHPLSRNVYETLPEKLTVTNSDVGPYPTSKSNYLNYLISGVQGD